MNFIKEYSITIITGVIFITIIFSIVPDNSIKKYVKFILSLLLISLFITPIFNFLNKDLQVFSYESKLDYILKESKIDYSNYEKERIEETKENFSKNINKLVKDTLSKKYVDFDFNVKSKIDYDLKNNFKISNIYVNYKSNKIKKVDKIGESKEINKEGKEMIDYLSSSLKIDKRLINVVEE